MAAWVIDVPPGHSSLALSEETLFLTAVEKGKTLVTLAFDKASGDRRWRAVAPEAPLEKVHATSSPAASTPLVDAERVIVYFGSFGLLCYNHEGKELWRRAIPTPQSLYGMSTSPIAHGEHLILVLDDERTIADSKLTASKLVAIRRATGETVWETPRPLVRSGWSTPSIVPTSDGGEELVVLGQGRVYGYDPDTGEEKWFVDGFSRETIAVPVVGNGHVYVSAAMLGGVSDEQPDREPFWNALLPFDQNGNGKIERVEMSGDFTFPLRPDLPIGHPGFGIPLPSDPQKREERRDGFLKWVDRDEDGAWSKEELLNHLSFDRGKPNLMAIRPGGMGDVTKSQVSWALHRNIPEVPSPLFYQNRLYLVRDGGVLSVVDAANGKTIYRKRLGASGHYSASPVCTGDHLYLASNEGVVTVVSTGDTFEIRHQVDLGEPIHATPSLGANTLYVRTHAKIYAFRP